MEKIKIANWDNVKDGDYFFDTVSDIVENSLKDLSFVFKCDSVIEAQNLLSTTDVDNCMIIINKEK